MPDRILTAEIAQALQDDSTAEDEALVWIVTGGEGEMLARPVAAGRGALAYVLFAETLAGLRALLPAGLVRSPRMPGDPAGVIEMWYPAGP